MIMTMEHSTMNPSVHASLNQPEMTKPVVRVTNLVENQMQHTQKLLWKRVLTEIGNNETEELETGDLQNFLAQEYGKDCMSLGQRVSGRLA